MAEGTTFLLTGLPCMRSCCLNIAAVDSTIITESPDSNECCFVWIVTAGRTDLERPGVNCRLRRPRLPDFWCFVSRCEGCGPPPVPVPRSKVDLEIGHLSTCWPMSTMSCLRTVTYTAGSVMPPYQTRDCIARWMLLWSGTGPNRKPNITNKQVMIQYHDKL